MDAVQLARWTRFAAKGGIGKCTAVQDCVAESAEDLMFLKDDEITVLLQVPDTTGQFLGYCEGVVGHFQGSDVCFHAKLKRPVITKRSSASAVSVRSKSISPSTSMTAPSETDLESLRMLSSPVPIPRSDSRASQPSTTPISISKSSFSEEEPLFRREMAIPPLSIMRSPLVTPQRPLLTPEQPHSAMMPYSAQAVENFHETDSPQEPLSSPEDVAYFRQSVPPRTDSHPSNSSYSREGSLLVSPDVSPRLRRKPSLAQSGEAEGDDDVMRTASPEPMPTELLDTPHADSSMTSESTVHAGHVSFHDSSVADQSGPSMARMSNFSDAGFGVGLAMLQDLADDDDDDNDSYLDTARYSRMPLRNSAVDKDVDDDLPSIHSGDELYGSPESATVELPAHRFHIPITEAQPTHEDHNQTAAVSESRPASSQMSGSEGGDDGEWDGASAFFDNYRYSRYSTASKMSGYSYVSKSSARSREQDQAPPVPADGGGQRPAVNRMYSYDSVSQQARSSLPLSETPNFALSPTLSAFGEAQLPRGDTPSRGAAAPSPGPALVVTDDTRDLAPIDTTTPTSPTTSTAPLSIRRKPNPLDFASPLLHTNFSSPADSQGPIPHGLSSPLLSPALSVFSQSSRSGGAASALRQRLEVERGPSPAPSIESRFAELKDGPGMGRGIVVEDDEDQDITLVASRVGSPLSPTSGIGKLPPLSPGLTSGFLHPNPDTQDVSSPPTSPIEFSRHGKPSKLVAVNPSTPSPPISPVDAPGVPSGADDTPHIPQHQMMYEAAPSSIRSPPANQFSTPVQSFPLPSTDSPPPPQQPLSPPSASVPLSESASSLFPPHPNAPNKRASVIQRPFGLEGGQPQRGPVNLTNTSLLSTMQMAAAARFGPGGMIRLTTLFGCTVRDLSASEGPVGIVWSLEPFPNQGGGAGGGGRAGLVRKQVPQRAATTHAMLSPTTSTVPSTPQQEEVTPAERRPASSTIEQKAIPRANFFPKVGTARPRSRSFSGLPSVSPNSAAEKEGSKGEQGQKKSRRTPSTESLKARGPTKSPSLPAAFKTKAPPSPRSAHAPSPLSLPQNNVVLSSPSTATKKASPLARPPLTNPEEAVSMLAYSPNPMANERLPSVSQQRSRLRQVASSVNLKSGGGPQSPPSSPRFAHSPRRRNSAENGLGLVEVIPPMSSATGGYPPRDRGGVIEVVPPMSPVGGAYPRERGGMMEVVPPMSPMSPVGGPFSPRERAVTSPSIVRSPPPTPGLIEGFPPMSPVGNVNSQSREKTVASPMIIHSPPPPGSIEVNPPMSPMSPGGGVYPPPTERSGVVSPMNVRSPPLISRPSLDKRSSEDVKTSSGSRDTRSFVRSPTPVSSPTISSPPHTANSLTAKSSLSALQANRDLRRDRDTVSETQSSFSISPATPTFEYPPETVQVKDTDFEMVRPSIMRQSSERHSDESSIRDGRPSITNDLRSDSPAPSSLYPVISRTQSQAASDGGSSTQGQIKASDSNSSVEAHRARELKWISAMSSTPSAQARKSKKIRKLLQEGVPASVRYLVWAHLTDSKSKRIDKVYTQLGRRERVAVFEEIERDARTCFSEHPHLHDAKGPLVSVLNGYLRMVPDIDYDRSLAIIAGHLLLQSPEEDAFWTFLSMMDAQLRPYFSPRAVQMEADALLFSRILETVDAQLYQKLLIDMDVSPLEFCRPWFSSLFAGVLPPDHVNRVWDIYLYEGPPFLFRVGLAILLSGRQDILAFRDKSRLLSFLLQPPGSSLPSDPDVFLNLALSVRLKDDDIKKQRLKLEAQLKRQTQAPSRSATANSATISLPRS